MIDEDDAVDALERLRARIAEGGGRVVAGAAVVRRGPRILAFPATDPETAVELPTPPEDSRWTLGLTDWGRLEMAGDVRAAGEWLSRVGWNA